MNSKSNLYASLIFLAYMLFANFAVANNPNPIEHCLDEFSVYNVEGEVILEWLAKEDSEVKYFIVERATGDSNFFKEIGKIKTQDNLEEVLYLFSDEDPELYNHYRIKIVLENGYTQVSPTLKAQDEQSQMGKHNSENLNTKG